MYRICPKCQYERQSGDSVDQGTCPACGIIFSKWMKRQFADQSVPIKTSPWQSNASAVITKMSASLFFVEDKINPFVFYGRGFAFIVMVVWGWYFINIDFVNESNKIASSFMHSINLVFHEAGHMIFMPLGWFIQILGGTLGQLLMPLIVMLVFLLQHQNNFGAAVALWWLGQSFMDCAPYIDDARLQQLVLLGGVTGADKPGYHDWNNILIELGWLESHRQIAHGFNNIGILLILLACCWSGLLLFKQFKNLET